MKENEKQTPQAAQETRKKGFVLRQDYLKSACHFLDDTALGTVLRNIYEFVENPAHVAKLDPIPQICYYQLTEGIKEENQKYYKILKQRQENYQAMKRRANGFLQNNNDKTDKGNQTEQSLKSEIPPMIGKDNDLLKDKEMDMVGSGTVGSGTVGNSTEDTIVSNTSYKNYSIKNNIFFNEIYTRNYLAEKKIFIKKEFWTEFFNYNCDIGWPYKAETAARRFLNKNPKAVDDGKTREENKKNPPKQPATPAELQATRRAVWEVLKENVSQIEYKNLLQWVHVTMVQKTVEGHKVQFSAKSKSAAEIIIQNHQATLNRVWEQVTKQKVIYYEWCFPDDGGIKYIMGTPENLKKHCLKPQEEEAAN